MTTVTVTYTATIHDPARLRSAAQKAEASGEWDFFADTDTDEALGEMVAWAIDRSKGELADVGVEVVEVDTQVYP